MATTKTIKKTEVQINLENFFAEKEIPFKLFEVEHKGTTHLVENTFIKEIILTKTGHAEQLKIRQTLTMIDFKNGNVNHFLEHLANGYVKTNY